MALAIVRDGVRFWIVVLGLTVDRIGPFYSRELAEVNASRLRMLSDWQYGLGYASGFTYGRLTRPRPDTE